MTNSARNHRSYLLAINLLMAFKLAGSKLHNQAMFSIKQHHCLRVTDIISSHEMDTVDYCLLSCISTSNCEGIGYIASNSTCTLGSVVMDSDFARDSYCVINDGESVYMSVSYDIPSCDEDDGWYADKANARCMKLFPAALREDAEWICEDNGAELASFQSQESIDVFRSLAENPDTGFLGNGHGIWTAALQINGTYRWPDNTTDILWSTSQPDGNGPCTQLWRSNYLIDDIGCTGNKEFACVKDL